MKSLFSKGSNTVKFDVLAKQLCDELNNYEITSDEFVEVVAMRKKNVKDTRITIWNANLSINIFLNSF